MTNTLNLIWKSESGKSFNIGELTSSGEKYYFQYNLEETKEAILEGFSPIEGFPNINVKYFREEPFNTFQKWLGDRINKEGNNLEALKKIAINGFSFSGGNFLDESLSAE